MIPNPLTMMIPLKIGDDGTIRVNNTRVTLDTIIARYHQGDNPEEIHEGFSTVPINDIYAIIAYYLAHRDELDDYLKRQEEEAERMAKKMLKGLFTLEDMAQQLSQIRKMGSLEGLMGMMPGAQKMKSQIADANVDDKMIAHQEAIIMSMTPKERKNPKVIKSSRRKRIAAGSGTTVQEVNRLLKQHKQISTMMKKAGKMGKRGLMGGNMPPGMMGGNIPGMR